MNIFDRMSKETLRIISNNSNGSAIYQQGNLTVETYAVINYDVEKNPDVLLSGISEKITAVEFSHHLIEKAKRGDTISFKNGVSFKVDEEIENDGSIIRAQVS